MPRRSRAQGRLPCRPPAQTIAADDTSKLTSAYPSLSSSGPPIFPLEINELLLQEPARSLEVNGNFEPWLLPEALNSSFKTNRRNPFLRVLKVSKESNLGARWYGLLQCHSRPVKSDVVEHPLEFHLVVMPIGNLDGDRAADLKSFCIAHAALSFRFRLRRHHTGLKQEAQSPFGMSLQTKWHEEGPSSYPPISLFLHQPDTSVREKRIRKVGLPLAAIS